MMIIEDTFILVQSKNTAPSSSTLFVNKVSFSSLRRKSWERISWRVTSFSSFLTYSPYYSLWFPPIFMTCSGDQLDANPRFDCHEWRDGRYKNKKKELTSSHVILLLSLLLSLLLNLLPSWERFWKTPSLIYCPRRGFDGQIKHHHHVAWRKNQDSSCWEKHPLSVYMFPQIK